MGEGVGESPSLLATRLTDYRLSFFINLCIKAII